MQFYQSPLTTRYASIDMQKNFGEYKKIYTWRKLWIILAESEMNLGININSEQIKELKNNMDKIDFEKAKTEEIRLKHDVMAHLTAYASICPLAAPIIHLGATSCYIGDNSDLIIMKDAFQIILPKLIECINVLSIFAQTWKDTPTLGYTHFQPAQLTTVGKRACLWLNDLLRDYHSLINFVKEIKHNFRGVKGTTGTQASFLTLFDGDFKKVQELDDMVTALCGFSKSSIITGQTYSRKLDYDCLSKLSSLGLTIHKMCTDIRLLAHLKEIEEPFEDDQIGSSAMAYKRNPMLSERCCSLSRHLGSLAQTMFFTGSVQWLERSLDDSASKRICIPESFLIVDSLLETVFRICKGLIVNPKVIQSNINKELPFMATENIMMEMVKRGHNRQECHEKIRQLSMKASENVKKYGLENNLIDLIVNEEYFKCIKDDIHAIIEPTKFIGLSSKQVETFINAQVNQVLTSHVLDMQNLFGSNLDMKKIGDCLHV